MKSTWPLLRLFCLATLVIPVGSRASGVTLSQHACKPRGAFHCFTVTASKASSREGITGSNVTFWLFGHFHFMATVAEIPWEIHTLMTGSAADKSSLAQQIVGAQAGLYNYYAMAEYLSVACTEDIPFISDPPKTQDVIASIYHGQLAAKREASILISAHPYTAMSRCC